MVLVSLPYILTSFNFIVGVYQQQADDGHYKYFEINQTRPVYNNNGTFKFYDNSTQPDVQQNV